MAFAGKARGKPDEALTSSGSDGPTGTAHAPALCIDALGRKCPIPIIMLAERIGEAAVGEAVQVLADDPAAKTDLPAWCALKSHDFIGFADLPGDAGWAFLIRRSY